MLILDFNGMRESRSAPSPFSREEPVAIVLGGFDGMHSGHRALLREAQKSGLPVLLTTMFGGKGKELFTREERRRLFEKAGISYLLELNLTEDVAALSAEEFLMQIFALVPAGLVVCGEDFRFGRNAIGTPALLKEMAPCPVHVRKAVKYLSEEDGQARKYSASSCKALLGAGDMARLNACLCSAADDFFLFAYHIGGIVEHGRGVGRTYGFPTLNLAPPAEKLLPPDGVYGGLCATPQGNFPTIVNIGSSPTFGIAERKIEAYLDGFSGDLYGAEVDIYPTEFFRPIQKFSSADDLKVRLGRDIVRLRAGIHSTK